MSQPAMPRVEEGGFTGDHVEGALGHAVVVTGLDTADEPSIAVWTSTPMGAAAGAWIYPHAAVLADPALAAQVLSLTTGRAIVGWDDHQSVGLLRHLEKAADQPQGDWQRRMLPLPSLLTDIREHREALSIAVGDHATATKTKPAPLEWRQSVPEAASMIELAAHAAARRPSHVTEVAASALHLLHLLRWLATLWHETEESRLRRRYLDSFGPAAPLPPSWLAVLRQA